MLSMIIQGGRLCKDYRRTRSTVSVTALYGVMEYILMDADDLAYYLGLSVPVGWYLVSMAALVLYEPSGA